MACDDDLDDNDLPEAYVLALRLRRDGIDAAGIAEQIGIEPAAVPALLRLADAKLGRVRARPGSRTGSDE